MSVCDSLSWWSRRCRVDPGNLFYHGSDEEVGVEHNSDAVKTTSFEKQKLQEAQVSVFIFSAAEDPEALFLFRSDYTDHITEPWTTSSPVFSSTWDHF